MSEETSLKGDRADRKRPPIPDPVRRAVRQRCYFGCVVCGCPVFEYDHITPYSEAGCHEESNLTLLCSMHHDAKTHKKMSEALVRHHNSNPYNNRAGYTSPYKIMPDRRISVMIGGSHFIKSFPDGNGAFSCLAISAKSPTGSHIRSFATIHAEDGWLSLSMDLTDKDGNTILQINQGEIISSSGVWDFHYEGATIKIRNRKGSILLDMDFASDRCEIRKGMFFDEMGDGFLVAKGWICPVVAKTSGASVNVTYIDCIGGMLIYHEEHYPNDRSSEFPRGFGFLYMVPMTFKRP